MNTLINKIENMGVVPVVAINDMEQTDNIAKALIESNLPIIEITFRTKFAKDAIAKIKQDYKDILVGAGTIINLAQAKEAHNLNVDFIVTPGYNQEVVDYCLENNIEIFAGCITPTEVMQAINSGLKNIKVFPCMAFGGMKLLKSLSGPFPQVKFMPTGGINAGNLKEFLSYDKILACGGSWMITNDYDKMVEEIKNAVKLVKEVR